jgi:hypothetical protein
MELTRSSLRIVVNGRTVTVGGEAYLRGFGSPDFVVYKNSIKLWDDGQSITHEEMDQIMMKISDESLLRNLNIVFE